MKPDGECASNKQAMQPLFTYYGTCKYQQMQKEVSYDFGEFHGVSYDWKNYNFRL